MKLNRTIPIFRIFDETKAREFYIDWLGFSINWEHRFAADAPLYVEIELNGLTLHLSEHHGDATPGSKVFIDCENLTEYHAQISAKNYKYGRPGLNQAFWDSLTMDIADPFGNRLLFNQYPPK
jgi:uncharacterized glyoxalase superfamily protein PhnB